MGSLMKTIFEKIIDGEIPAEKIYEDDQIIVIKDIHPKAPIHLLIITKKVIPNIQSIPKEDLPLLAAIFEVGQKMAKQFGLEESGYRILVNNGGYAGQIVPHLHFHLLGGKVLGDIG